LKKVRSFVDSKFVKTCDELVIDEEMYDKKDPYGNKDLLPAAKSMRMLDNVWHQLDSLPEQYRDFYGRQLIARLEQKCLSKKDITE
jgi:hypothetical protein